jgi:hypothetical protein
VTPPEQSDSELREAFKRATMARRQCDEAEADVILQRIADRLDGYSHDEAVERHPLQPERDEACGTSSSSGWCATGVRQDEGGSR